MLVTWANYDIMMKGHGSRIREEGDFTKDLENDGASKFDGDPWWPIGIGTTSPIGL